MLLVLVSHSKDFALQTKKYLLELLPSIDTSLEVDIAAGLSTGEMGTDINVILEIINNSKQKDVLLVPDIGSSVMNCLLAKDMVNNKNVEVSKGAFLEGLLNLLGSYTKKMSLKEALERANEKIEK